MRHPQVLVWETDGRLAGQLAGLWDEHRWALREPRKHDACLRLLRDGGPSVLVVRVGSDLPDELGLIETVHRVLPSVPVVAVGDPADAVLTGEVPWEVGTDPVLAGLLYDLGAAFVLFPPLPRDLLHEVVVGLMRSATAATLGERGDGP
jgi:hypothetical protein